MRALFVGGTVDNTELDMDDPRPPLHYPAQSGADEAFYRLCEVGRRDGDVVYAVYGAAGLDASAVHEATLERAYARRFNAVAETVQAATGTPPAGA